MRRLDYFQSRPGRTKSLVMIVKDEEELLPTLLERVVPWVDEAVIVDTGSTDNTVDVMKEYGVRIFHRKLTSFSDVKNFALDQAGGDWVIALDADEMPTEDLLNFIHIWISYASHFPKVRGLAVTRENRLNGEPLGGGLQFEKHVRVFRRDSWMYQGDLHERPVLLGKWKVEEAPPQYLLYHHKTRERQRKQDAFYLEFARRLGDPQLIEIQSQGELQTDA